MESAGPHLLRLGSVAYLVLFVLHGLPCGIVGEEITFRPAIASLLYHKAIDKLFQSDSCQEHCFSQFLTFSFSVLSFSKNNSLCFRAFVLKNPILPTINHRPCSCDHRLDPRALSLS